MPSSMEYMPSKVALPQKFRAECQSNGAVGNHLPELRSSLSLSSSSVKVLPAPTRNGEVKLVSRRGMDLGGKPFAKIVRGDGGYVLEDVPHLTDYIADLPVSFGCCFFMKSKEQIVSPSCCRCLFGC